MNDVVCEAVSCAFVAEKASITEVEEIVAAIIAAAGKRDEYGGVNAHFWSSGRSSGDR